MEDGSNLLRSEIASAKAWSALAMFAIIALRQAPADTHSGGS